MSVRGDRANQMMDEWEQSKTFSNARRLATANGFTLRWRDGEYRLNHKGGTEDTAYYTNDLEDALSTMGVLIAGGGH